jgi:hypothetical protein
VKLLGRLFAIVMGPLLIPSTSISATFDSLSTRSMINTPYTSVVLLFSKLRLNGEATPRDVEFDLHSRTDYRDKICIELNCRTFVRDRIQRHLTYKQSGDNYIEDWDGVPIPVRPINYVTK